MDDQPPEVLSYRNAPVTGVIVPEAEALIDEGAGPQDIQHFFPHPRQAVIYFCHAMARRCDLMHLDGVCVGCGAGGCSTVIEVFWTAEIPVTFAPTYAYHFPRDTFGTYHSVCLKCLRLWLRQRSITQRLRILLLAAAMLGFIAIMLIRAWILTHGDSAGHGAGGVLAGVAILIIGISYFSAGNFRRDAPLPAALQQRIAGRARFEGLGDMMSQDEAKIRSAEQVRPAEMPPKAAPIADPAGNLYPDQHDDSTGT